MNSPASQPGLPTWLFVVTDLALIAAAAAIAVLSPAPLSTPTMLLIVGCVGLGALVGLVPLVARYERLKNETLDNRQRALESLSQTVHETAQQISIATGSLHEIADLAQKNLRHAEHLPHKLQEKIAEFQAQLADANDAEKAELEQELTALRTSESERLESISSKIAKSAADWTRLEAAAAQHLAALQEALGKFPARATAEFTRLQESAEQAVGTARESALQGLQQAEGESLRRLAEAYGTSLATLQAQVTTLEQRLLAAASAASDRAAADFRSSTAATIEALAPKLAQLTALAASLEVHAGAIARATPAVPPAASVPVAEAAAPAPAETASDPAEPAPADAPAAAPAIASPPAPKRQRRTRKEDGVPTNPPLPVPAEPAAPETPPTAPSAVPASSADPAASAAAPDAPSTSGEAPPPATPPPVATPPADLTLPPFAMAAPPAPPAPPPAETAAPPPIAPVDPAPPPTPAADSTPAPAPAPIRKRAPRKPEPAPEPGLDLGFDDSTPAPGSGQVEQTLSSDGATRLIATAYIGIGNRLFIRGDGPGLTWERGVPLQFVSIGKWRWETNDATAPIRFKLYKNDEHECVALGEKTLAPGHLHELVAAF